MNEMKMLISAVLDKEGTKKACVRFEQGEDYAEGFIPDCKITASKGFNDEEKEQLEEYMKGNLEMLKRQAASVDPILNMIKD